MERFNWERGLIHMVFANVDTYYLGSLVRLDSQRYLYYELKKKGYAAVFFLSGTQREGRYEAEMLDPESCSVYGKYGKTVWDIFKTAEQQEKKTASFKNLHSFLRQMLEMMRKEKRFAFVFSVETFAELKQYDEMVGELSECAAKNSSRGHIILVCAPVTAQGTRDYFSDAHGIFQSRLFPEIREIFQGPANVHIYEKLKEEMGDRMVLLNLLEREQISRLVRRFLMEKRTLWEEYADRADDYGDVIWAWYHASGFREKEKNLLPQNDTRMLQAIWKWLSEPGMLAKLDGRVSRIREEAGSGQPLWKWIIRRWPEDKWIRCIYEDSAMLRKLENLRSADLDTDNDPAAAARIWSLLSQITDEMKRPSRLLQDRQTGIYLNQCIEFLQKGWKQSDLFLTEKACEALKYGVCGQPAQVDGQEQSEFGDSRRSLYISILQIAERIRGMEEQYEEDGREIRRQAKELGERIGEIRAYEKKYGRGNPDPSGKNAASGVLYQLSVKKAEAVALQRDIKNQERIRTMNLELMEKGRQNIRDMEQAIRSIMMEGTDQMKKNAAYANGLISRSLMENDRLLKDLSEADQENKIRIEEIHRMHGDAMQSSWTDIELEFDRMAKEEQLYEQQEITL